MIYPFVYLPGEHAWAGKLNGVIWATGRKAGREKFPARKQDDKSGRWYSGGNITRGATSNGGVEYAASSMLLLRDASSLEIHFCSSAVSSDKFRIFFMENEFSLAENEKTPGVEDAIPLVAIMVPAQGVVLLSWGCKMASSLGWKALEFMIINLSVIMR